MSYRALSALKSHVNSPPYPFRVGFVSDKSAYFGDGVWLPSGLGRLIEIIAQQCTSLVLAVSKSPSKHPLADYLVETPAYDIIPMPWLPSNAQGFWKGGACRTCVREVERRSDVVIVQLPFAAPSALLAPRKPRVYNIIADIRAITESSNFYTGTKKAVAVTMARGIDRFQQHLAHRHDARVVTHGPALLSRYGKDSGRAIVSSTILESEIATYSRQRSSEAPFRVLYVGYLRYEKGIQLLLDSFCNFHRIVPHSELHIIGGNDLVDHGIGELIQGAQHTVNQEGVIQVLGPKEFGPGLFQSYADADVLVLASRSEGTPRVLVEARAFGCPVIATNVGGVPASIEDGVDGLLVKPGDSHAITVALLRIAQDASLRSRLIAGGTARAHRTTIESYATHLLEEAHVLQCAQA